MLSLLRDKKVIFFDVGYTLDKPASGDWMFTSKFLELSGERLRQRGAEEIREAREKAIGYLERHHLVSSVEAECRQFADYYSMINESLDLGLTGAERELIARDRTCNMDNYIPYPGVKEVLEILHRTHRLGVLSDTWPSIEQQLVSIGAAPYLSYRTFSFCIGVFKPDRRLYLDALGKSGVSASEAVFIDDSPRNLDGAAALGITPILMAANPESDVDTPYRKIRDLRELIPD